MQVHTGAGEHRSPVGFAVVPQVAQQLGHGSRGTAAVTEGLTGNRPQLLLELACGRCLDRAVPGVVGSRGNLVDEDSLGGVEEFDTQHADEPEPRRNEVSGRTGSFGGCVLHSGGDGRRVEDVVGVGVLHHAVVDDVAIDPERQRR